MGKGRPSVFKYLNIVLTVIVLLESIATLLVHLDILPVDQMSYITKSLSSFIIPQETKQPVPTLSFAIASPTPIPTIIITELPTATPTNTPTPTLTPTQTTVTPATISLTPSPTVPIPTPSLPTVPAEPSETNTASESATINYYALGEKKILKNTFIAKPLISELLPDRLLHPETIFLGGKIKTVFLIVLEDANWSHVIGNFTDAPYINGRIVPQSSYANNYYTPVGIHPNVPNHIWLEAGSHRDFTGKSFTTDADANPENSIAHSSHLTTLLHKAGFSWKTYIEEIDGTTCPLKSQDLYAASHNPLVFFQDVTTNEAYCVQHQRPFKELSKDLKQNTVANYTMIIPNLCNSMHNDCTAKHNKLNQADTWLARTLPEIMKSQAYKDGGAIFITWDEGEKNTDDPIGLFVISPFAKGNGYSNALYYTHSSLLRTIEEIFALPFLGDSNNARNLGDLFISNAEDVSFSYFPLKIPEFSSPDVIAKINR